MTSNISTTTLTQPCCLLALAFELTTATSKRLVDLRYSNVSYASEMVAKWFTSSKGGQVSSWPLLCAFARHMEPLDIRSITCGVPWHVRLPSSQQYCRRSVCQSLGKGNRLRLRNRVGVELDSVEFSSHSALTRPGSSLSSPT